MQEVEISLEQYTEEHISPQILSKPLSDAVAAEIIDHLKQEADRYWFIDLFNGHYIFIGHPVNINITGINIRVLYRTQLFTNSK